MTTPLIEDFVCRECSHTRSWHSEELPRRCRRCSCPAYKIPRSRA